LPWEGVTHRATALAFCAPKFPQNKTVLKKKMNLPPQTLTLIRKDE
jgi:hypothetical protein